MTTHYIPNWEQPHHIKDLQFEDALETTKNWVSYIHEHEKPDLLVVAYHGDLSAIYKLENRLKF